MGTGAITSHIDVAQIVLYAFWVFFVGLVIYLQRESRREGYPLVSEVDGRTLDHGAVWVPDPKSFLLSDGTTVTVPQPQKDQRQLPLENPIGAAGFPFVPTGEPMAAGVGPGAYTPRANRPDVTAEGAPRIVPMRSAPDFSIAGEDPDPRGMTVIGADWAEAGTIVDVWVDRAECVARYFEVQLAGMSARPARAATDAEAPVVPRLLRVLLPVNFTQINALSNRITVKALLAAQFAGVPATANPDLVTLAEEDRICAYYGGGMLYATPMRQESWL
jgi:photosynthetic reaction center H subunit